MKTKLANLINVCSTEISCDRCSCNERECLINLLSTHNNECDEADVITCDDFE